MTDDEESKSIKEGNELECEYSERLHETKIKHQTEKYRKFIESLNGLGAGRELRIEILLNAEREKVTINLEPTSLEVLVCSSASTPLSEARFRSLLATALAGTISKKVFDKEFHDETFVSTIVRKCLSYFNLWLPRTSGILKTMAWYEESKFRNRAYSLTGKGGSFKSRWLDSQASFILIEHAVSASISEIFGKICRFSFCGLPFKLDHYQSMHFMDNEDLFSKNRTIVVKTVIESKYFLLEPTYGRIIYVSSKLFDSIVKNPTFRRVLNSVAEHFYMSEDENNLISMNSSTLGKLLSDEDGYLVYPIALVGVSGDVLVGNRLKQLWEKSFYKVFQKLGLDIELIGYFLTAFHEHFLSIFSTSKEPEHVFIAKLRPVERVNVFHFFAIAEGLFDAIYKIKTGSSAKSMFALLGMDKFTVFRDKFSWVIDSVGI